MTEYIDRQSAIGMLSQRKHLAIKEYNYDEVRLMDFLIDSIEDLPSADVRENVHGEWIYKKGDMVTCADGWSCSHCKCTYHTRVPYFKDFNFCPNCGADMREVNDG